MVCPGCIGRGAKDVCRICGLLIPEHLRLGPDHPGPQANPALDGWAFNLLLEQIDEMQSARSVTSVTEVPGRD
jgi:hypothetical protein